MSVSSLPIIQYHDAAAAIAAVGDTTISQAQFLAQTTALAERLSDVKHLLNLCGGRYHFLCGFSSALVAGATNVLPPNIQNDTLLALHARYIDACFLIDDDRFLSLPNVLDIRTVIVQAGDRSESASLQHVSINHPAAIAFTSGSTGQPQAYVKPWKTLAGTAALLGERFGCDVGAHPHVLATVPSQHMYGLEMTVMMALQAGWVMHAAHPFFPQDVAQALANMPEPRVLVSTPVHLRALVGAQTTMPTIALIVSATAPLSDELAAAAERMFGAPVKEIYGCTEAGSLATRRTTSAMPWETLSGMCLQKNGADIAISGDHLDADVPLGDVFEALSDTQFNLLGRASDMLNVGGKRASLKDLNERLLAIDGVDDGVIFVPENRQHVEPRPAALVVSPTLHERDILTALGRCIDPVFLPRPCRKVSSLPRNKVGKLPVQALSALLKENHLDE